MVLNALDVRNGVLLGSDASSTNGLLGEDLVLGCLVNYFSETVDSTSRVIGYKCKRPGRKGNRLDAWVLAGEILYQVEVKNWSAHSYGGRVLSDTVSLNSEEAQEYNMDCWNYFITNRAIHDPKKGICKAWNYRMTPPKTIKFKEIVPLVAFWRLIFDPNTTPGPMSSFPVESADFSSCMLFSASAFLRQKNSTEITLKLPRFFSRMRSIRKLLSDESWTHLSDVSTEDVI